MSGTVSPARAAAFAILTRVLTTAAHSDDLLHGPAVNALSAADRNLTTALVLGVLRWQLALDAEVRPLLQRPDAELHPAALLALRLGLFQLGHMDRVPAWAAIDESVELARANGAAHAAGMVNALLRRWLREHSAAADAKPVRQTLAAAMTPAEVAHPAWLMQRWRARYGGRAARSMAAYDQAEPATGGLFEAEEAVGFAGYRLPAIDDGSRLVAELAAAAVEAPARVLDVCAAPGGKTRVLALRHPGAAIVAVDANERRMEKMRARLEVEPAACAIETVVVDMSSPVAEVEGKFDLVLVDAPCSGTGTLGRNPEIRHRLREGDLPRQAARQTAILRVALRKVAAGGVLVYSTCSMETEENEAVAASVAGEAAVVPMGELLERVPGLRVEALAALQASAVTAEGALRTVPGVHACDGFYAVVLRKH